MASVRVAAASLASLVSRRAATADRPSANAPNAKGAVVLPMASVRVAAALVQAAAASLVSRRAATADRPLANARNASGAVVLLMASVRVAAALHAVCGL